MSQKSSFYEFLGFSGTVFDWLNYHSDSFLNCWLRLVQQVRLQEVKICAGRGRKRRLDLWCRSEI